MPVGTYNATDVVELKRERLFEVSTLYVRYTRKNTVFDDFFHKLTKRITSENDTAGKMGPTCCPTIRSTGINPQLVVPVRYKALTVGAAAWKRQLHHNPALSQWHFVVVFCQFRQKPGFFMQNVSQKGLQGPLWLSLHYVA